MFKASSNVLEEQFAVKGVRHIRNGAHLNGWSVGGGQGQISGEGKRQRKERQW